MEQEIREIRHGRVEAEIPTASSGEMSANEDKKGKVQVNSGR